MKDFSSFHIEITSPITNSDSHITSSEFKVFYTAEFHTHTPFQNPVLEIYFCNKNPQIDHKTATELSAMKSKNAPKEGFIPLYLIIL